MSKYNTEYIKRIRPLAYELERYGIEVNRKGYANCPFHSEKTASFKVYKDGTFHCFGCGVYGDVIAFTMLINNISFEEACNKLNGDISYSEMRKADLIRYKRDSKLEAIKKLREEYWTTFDEWLLNETVFCALIPKTPFAEPSEMWLESLSKRSYLLHRLETVENRLTKFRL